MTTKDLKKIFDLIETEDGVFEAPVDEKTNQAEPENTTLSDDFEYSKRLIRELAETSIEAVKELTTIAKESEHPKAYEALSNATANAANLAKTLIELHKMKRDAGTPKDEPKNVSNITNQTIAVCSTDELLKLIDKKGVK